jgi:mono/diheme cytochrome c family protein
VRKAKIFFTGNHCWRAFLNGLATFLLIIASATSYAQVQFNRDIRPILSDNCFHCHGPDKDDRKADLRLDTAAGIVQDLGGYQAVVPGNAEKSELYKRIIHSDPEEKMPPKESHKHLTPSQIELLAQWIKEGAHWEEHWSFEPIKKPELASIGQSDWVSNPIDTFIMKRLDEQGLSPSKSADKYQLIRRVTFDLTGLPPTPEAVDAFIADSSTDAYEKLVDRLLTTSAYGEHQANLWLDVARYADTHGFHLDNYRSIWPYRDWVINAFNHNMPFDQFTIEQLAGDLLPGSNLQQKVATGFNRSNPTTSEGGAIDDEYFAIYAKDRAETTSAVWMGLTVGCATCHDHKYDPITQKEFFQFTAFFRNTTQPAMDGNSFNSHPFVKVPTAQEITQKSALESQINASNATIKALRKSTTNEFKQWRASGAKIPSHVPVTEKVIEFQAALNDGAGKVVKGRSKTKEQTSKVSGKSRWVSGKQGKALALAQDTHIVLGDHAQFNLKDSFSGSLWLRAPKKNRKIRALISRFDPEDEDIGWELSLKESGRLWFQIKGGKHPKYYVALEDAVKADTWQHIAFSYDGGAAEQSFNLYIDGTKKTLSKIESTDLTQLYNIPSAKSPLTIGNRKKIKNKTATKPSIALQDIRLFNEVLSDYDIQMLYRVPELKKIRQLSMSELNRKQADLLYQYYLEQVNPAGVKTLATLRDLNAQLSLLESRTVVTLVMEEKKDAKPEAHILNRGLYDQPGERVMANVPKILPPLPEGPSQNRLTLARWLVDGKHPLTARVTVNRFWQSLFGNGLVKTAGDFGSQGEPPSHPQLLDWLASEFMENGWDIKEFFKLMVMSSTYQQSSAVTPELLKVDAENRLLARAPRIRLSAEAIRDQALSVSGLLVDKVGGPPVKPYQPIGVWKAVAYVGSNTMNFRQDHGEDLYRKSLYTFRKRTAAPPSMSIFDAPDRESCNVKRDLTNTPLQALLLMNDPQFLEAARNMAEHIMKSEEQDKFAQLLKSTLGREPDKNMIAVLQKTYGKVLGVYQKTPEQAQKLVSTGESEVDKTLDSVELAAWTVVVNQVFNLDEFITKN